tara:strand:+ start:643 stop:1185 length:543 start_codon:yes stop_codon:yes gene_type:complete
MKIENLKQGQFAILSAKKVKGGKIQLMCAEKIKNPNLRPTSIVSILNKSDERFIAEAKPRFAWQSGEAEDIKNALGIDCSSLVNEGDVMEVNLLNPKINGEELHIQITETTKGDEYDFANLDTRAKRAGKDGDFILSAEGDYIFVKADVITGTPNHIFLEDTQRNTVASTDDAVAQAIGG